MPRSKVNIPEPNPSGLCMCGCQQPAPIADRTVSASGWVKGKPKRFINGHNAGEVGREPPGLNYEGLCRCGCGSPTPLSKWTNYDRGYKRGVPMQFIKGHSRRKSGVDYIEEQTGHDTPCWMWQRAMAGNSGYGMMWDVDTQTQRMAHVVYYERVNGPVPPGLVLDHLCRTRGCCRPTHLEAVTMAVNTRRGAHTKLTQADVDWIRANYGKISQSRMARQLGVSVTCVHAIVHGRTWREEELKIHWRVWVTEEPD